MIVRLVSGKDVTDYGSGNVGAMNVRRTTGSWSWFTAAMLADVLKGFLPTLAVRLGIIGLIAPTVSIDIKTAAAVTVLGTVIGHDFSMWMALLKRHFRASGKGLATGAGALLAYDWRYCLFAVAVALVVIAITRIMMAGQVAASLSLPLFAIVTRQPDWPFVTALGIIVYARHHHRFVGMLKGREPHMYIEDGQGPRG